MIVKETVPAALAGERLDRIVALVADVSRSEAADLVASGAVSLGGGPVTTRSHRVEEGAELIVDVPVRPSQELVPDPEVPVPVVYEDTDLLVVDKPAGVVVHPGAGRNEGTLVHGLLARYPELAGVGEPDRPGIVHRLDAGTSGLLLVARSAAAYDGLVGQLKAHAVDRRYRALVWGTVEAPAGVVDGAIGRSARDRTRMAVTLRGRRAVTHYEVRQRFHRPVAATELTCVLETGRTHQIRVHMSSIGHAVLGDPRYGGRKTPVPLGRPWLHAEHLELDHPVSGVTLSFEAPVPDDLTAVLAEFE